MNMNMNMKRPIFIAIAIASLLALGSGCSTAPRNFGGPVKAVTPEQVARLSMLNETATEADVVAILGQPSSRGSYARSDMVRAFGEGYAYEYHDTLPEDQRAASVVSTILGYQTAELAVGKEITYLAVFIREGRYVGYFWQGSGQLLPSELLAEVKSLTRLTDRQHLHAVLGPPNRGGGMKHALYAFRAPASLEAIGFDSLLVIWEGQNPDELLFKSVQPSFTLNFELGKPQAFGSAKKVSRQPDRQVSRNELVSQYHALVEKEMCSNQHVTTGSQVERCQRVLKQLRPTLPNDFGSMQLVVLGSDAFNACAMRRGKEISMLMYSGLLERISDDQELAFVMAHELSHVALGHLYVPSSYFLKLSKDSGLTTLYRSSQADELSADLHAAQLLARAGFNPSAGLSFLLKAQEYNPPPAELRFSTHPEHEARRILLNWYLDFLGLKKAGGSS
jgi:hypothetical protein